MGVQVTGCNGYRHRWKDLDFQSVVRNLKEKSILNNKLIFIINTCRSNQWYFLLKKYWADISEFIFFNILVYYLVFILPERMTAAKL